MTNVNLNNPQTSEDFAALRIALRQGISYSNQQIEHHRRMMEHHQNLLDAYNRRVSQLPQGD